MNAPDDTVPTIHEPNGELHRALQLTDPVVQREFAGFLRLWLSARGSSFRIDNLERCVRLFVVATTDALNEARRHHQESEGT